MATKTTADTRLADLFADFGNGISEAIHEGAIPWQQITVALEALRYVMKREGELRAGGPIPDGPRINDMALLAAIADGRIQIG